LIFKKDIGGNSISFSLFGLIDEKSKNLKKSINEISNSFKNGKTSGQDFYNKLKGLSPELQKTAISLKNSGKSGDECAEEFSELGRQAQTASIKTKALNIGMKALAVAGNMLVSMGISWVINAAVEGIMSLINTQQEAIEKAKEAAQAYNDEKESLKNLKQQYLDIVDGNDTEAE
jgi:prefoldin subunit 5